MKHVQIEPTLKNQYNDAYKSHYVTPVK